MVRLVLLIVIFISIFDLKAQETPTYNYTNWQTIKNEKLRVSLKLPEKWKYLEQKEPSIQAYFISDNEELGVKDISAKKILIESKAIGDDIKKIGDDLVKVVRSGADGKSFIREKESKLGDLQSREVTYHFREDGFEKTADVIVVKYKTSYYSFSFITSSRTNAHDKPLLEQILATVNFDVMQPSVAFEIKKPKDWFDFKDNEYSQAFSKIDKGDKSPSDGIIKVKMVKIDEEKSLQQFTVELSAQVTKEALI